MARVFIKWLTMHAVESIKRGGGIYKSAENTVLLLVFSGFGALFQGTT